MSLPVSVKVASCLHVSLDYLILGKTSNKGYYIYDARNVYKAHDSNNDSEIINLLNKCSPIELELIKKLIKTILPYMK